MTKGKPFGIGYDSYIRNFFDMKGKKMGRRKLLQGETTRFIFHLENPVRDVLESYGKKKGLRLAEVIRDCTREYATRILEEDGIQRLRKDENRTSFMEYANLYSEASQILLETREFEGVRISNVFRTREIFSQIDYLNYVFHESFKEVPWVPKGMDKYPSPEDALEDFRIHHELTHKVLSIKLAIAREYLAFFAWVDKWLKRREILRESMKKEDSFLEGISKVPLPKTSKRENNSK